MGRPTKEQQRQKVMQANQDGWQNLLTKMGTSGDNQTADTFKSGRIMSYSEAQDLYKDEGFGKRIVDLPVNDMTRMWIHINGDTDGDVIRYLAKIKAQKQTAKALRWAKVFGGALVVMLIDDGGKLDQPVNELKIKKVIELRAYDRWRVWWYPTDIEQDPNKPFYGLPTMYQVNPIEIGTSGAMFSVHASRVLRFEGEDVPELFRNINNGWGDSVYVSCFKQLANLGGVYHATRSIVNDFIQAVLQIDNLQELISSGREGDIKKRLNIMDLSRHVLNMTLIDTKEMYEKKSSTVTGLPEIIEKFTLALSAVRGIPHTLLMGQSPAGLSATGDSDIRFWYDSISAMQKDEMYDPLMRLVYLVMLSKEGPTKGKLIDGWDVIFNPLWQPSQKEIAETHKIQSEVDVNYINSGVVTPEEIALSRYGGQSYSFQTTLATLDRDDLLNQGVTDEPTDNTK